MVSVPRPDTASGRVAGHRARVRELLERPTHWMRELGPERYEEELQSEVRRFVAAVRELKAALPPGGR